MGMMKERAIKTEEARRARGRKKRRSGGYPGHGATHQEPTGPERHAGIKKRKHWGPTCPRWREFHPLRPEHRGFLQAQGYACDDKTVEHFNLVSGDYNGQEVITYRLTAGDGRECIRYRPVVKGGKWQSFNGHEVTVVGDFAAGRLLLCEGEPDMFELWERGIPGACTFTGGAWNVPEADKLEAFAGKDVAILYDIDGAGIGGAEKAWQRLAGIVREVRIVRLPLRTGKDLRDFFNQGGTVEEIRRLIEATHPRGHPNYREKLELVDRYCEKIHSGSNVKHGSRPLLEAMVREFVQRTRIYVGTFRSTFSAIGARWGMSPKATKNLLTRTFKAWGWLSWTSTVGSAGKTTFVLCEYPKVRFDEKKDLYPFRSGEVTDGGSTKG